MVSVFILVRDETTGRGRVAFLPAENVAVLESRVGYIKPYRSGRVGLLPAENVAVFESRVGYIKPYRSGFAFFPCHDSLKPTIGTSTIIHHMKL